MKTSSANLVRATIVENLFNHMATCGEDVGMIASNSFNFPVVHDAEEGWVEIVVKVVKDEEGYEKRSQYDEKVAARDERKKKKEEESEKRKAKVKSE